MKYTSRILFLCLGLTTASLRAGSVDSTSATPANGEDHGGIPFEFDFQYSYSGGDAEVARGRDPMRRDVRELEGDYIYSRLIYTPRIKFGILRLGAVYERFGFGAPNLFEVPSGLQSLSAVVGLDTQFSDSILVRFEVTPGFYSSKHLDGDDFHAPVILGGTYIYSSDLQFVFGISYDYEREYPVLPGGGVRWRMGSQWVLNAVLPTPRLEFEMTKNFTFYAGADLKGSTYRVDDRFGLERSGNTRLNHAVVTYTEIRAGLGLDWKIAPEIKVSFEGGYIPYRNFDFYRADVRYRNEEGAPYGSLAIRAAF